MENGGPVKFGYSDLVKEVEDLLRNLSPEHLQIFADPALEERHQKAP
ncbi:hypothetical protein VTL71DRAFT_9466 [Oculimacula yallundae]|uniref:Uncharacterized protein n=1 Tax=Oculimacula yallundae TaxID=86028 RepID=A0ABR4BS56_9HELO